MSNVQGKRKGARLVNTHTTALAPLIVRGSHRLYPAVFYMPLYLYLKFEATLAPCKSFL